MLSLISLLETNGLPGGVPISNNVTKLGPIRKNKLLPSRLTKSSLLGVGSFDKLKNRPNPMRLNTGAKALMNKQRGPYTAMANVPIRRLV